HFNVRQVARGQVQVLRGVLGDDQRAATQLETLELVHQARGLRRVDVERLDDRDAALAVELGQDHRDRGPVHLSVDLLREAARLGREGHAAADEDRSRQCAMTRAAALLLLRLLGGAVDLGARLLRLGAGTTGIAVRHDHLVDQVFAEFATEYRVGHRQRVVATVDGEFHRHLSLCLARGTHDDVTTRRTGDGALDCDQAALCVDLDHLQALRGLRVGAHVAGHLLARKHATRGLALADRAGRAMRQRVAVRRVAHAEVPALDRALEALALGDALDVDDLAGLEDVGLDLAAHLEVADPVVAHAQFPQAAAGFDLGLGQVARLGLVDQRGAPGADGHLHGAVAVGVHGLDLGDAVRGGLDQGHRDGLAVLGEHAAHAGLPAHDPQRMLLRHGVGPQVSLIWTSTPAASSSFISASTVLSLGSTMSSTRLCVRVSYWSRASLSTCGDTRTV